jgi:transcriptional regulator with XRE-family HTH domain
MEHTSARTKKPHLGKNIMRLRELQGMKQETLASLLGISQQAVSKMEGSESIEDDRLEAIAKALGVPSEIVKNFTEEAAFFNIQNNYDNATQNVNYQFNPFDKIVELYDALLKAEREKVALLEKILQEKK